jgi:hypothetical protein
LYELHHPLVVEKVILQSIIALSFPENNNKVLQIKVSDMVSLGRGKIGSAIKIKY